MSIVDVMHEYIPSVSATQAEVTRAMPGDTLVPSPMFTVTHAITIAAPAAKVWPWLAQMGSHRAGWYSYDRIDNGGWQSSHEVLPEFQDLEIGSVQPALPGAKDVFVVSRVDAPHDLVVTVPGTAAPIMTWEHLVEPIDGSHSRLIVRSRVGRAWKRMAREAQTSGAKLALIERVYRILGRIPDTWMIAIGSLGHRWMEARHMRGIKWRAETCA